MDRASLITDIRKFANEQLVSSFIPGKTYIPPASPQLLPEDVEALAEAVLQFWYTEWKFCRKFERGLETVTYKPHISLTNSGSSASLVSLTAANRMFSRKISDRHKKHKKLVLTCATGFPTTITPIYQNGLIPLFVDITENLTPNMEQIEFALANDKEHEIVGAVFAHNLGFPYDEETIFSLLSRERFFVSDCCDALGANLLSHPHLPVGYFADFSFMSFFPSHHIMAAEGGAVATVHPDAHALVDSLINWGRSCYCRPGENNTCGHRFDWPGRGDLPEGWDHKYIFDEIGYNLKMTDLQGALGWSQIQRIFKITQARRNNYAYLYRELSRYSDHLHLIPPSNHFSPFGFPVRVHDDFDLMDLIHYLEEHRIGTRRLFGGNLIRQPAFRNQEYAVVGTENRLAVSDLLMNKLFWISVSPSLTEPMLEYMVYTFDQYFITRGLA